MKLEVAWGKRLLSSTPVVLRAGPVTLWKQPKSAHLIVFFGFLLLGLAITFTASCDLYRAHSDLRYQHWLKKQKKE